jgi:predicted dehydrogenase
MAVLRVAVIGVGHLGKEHARILAGLPDVELAGVADVNGTQAEAVARRCGTRAFADHRSLATQVDAAIIAVPTMYHHTVAGDFLRRGVPILVEKPLALNTKQAKDLATLSDRYGALLQVGHIERFNPAFEALLERPLRPKYISCQRFGPYSGRSTDIGVVLDLMIHDLDLLLAWVRSTVAKVEAFGISVLGGHEDMATARLAFTEGCIADLSVSRIAPSPVRTLTAWGPEGFVGVDFARRCLTLVQPSDALCQHRRGLRPFDLAGIVTLKQDLLGCHLQTQELNCDTCDQLTRELQEFLRCVRTRTRPRVSGEEGLAAIALASRILQSIQTHAWEGRVDGPRGPQDLPEPQGLLFSPRDIDAAA